MLIHGEVSRNGKVRDGISPPATDRVPCDRFAGVAKGRRDPGFELFGDKCSSRPVFVNLHPMCSQSFCTIYSSAVGGGGSLPAQSFSPSGLKPNAVIGFIFEQTETGVYECCHRLPINASRLTIIGDRWAKYSGLARRFVGTLSVSGCSTALERINGFEKVVDSLRSERAHVVGHSLSLKLHQ